MCRLLSTIAAPRCVASGFTTRSRDTKGTRRAITTTSGARIAHMYHQGMFLTNCSDHGTGAPSSRLATYALDVSSRPKTVEHANAIHATVPQRVRLRRLALVRSSSRGAGGIIIGNLARGTGIPSADAAG